MATGLRIGTSHLVLFAACNAACTAPNPAFFLDADGASSGATTATTIDVSTASGPPPESTTGALEPTTAGATGADSEATSSTSSDSSDSADTIALDTTGASTTEPLPGASSTGEPALKTVELPADVAACILLPTFLAPFYADPADCEVRVADGVGYGGGVIVDTSFVEGGNGRPARVYLRFTLPEDLATVDLVSVELELHVADIMMAGSSSSGVLSTTEPFLAADLDGLPAPDPIDDFQDPFGDTADGSTILRTIPLELLDPGGALHLGIFPTSNDGVVFAGNNAPVDLRPVLIVTYYE